MAPTQRALFEADIWHSKWLATRKTRIRRWRGSADCIAGIVLMGSSTAPVPLNYLQAMFNNLEIIGNFTHAPNAYLSLLALVRSGQLDLRPIRPNVFAFSDVERAMEAARK